MQRPCWHLKSRSARQSQRWAGLTPKTAEFPETCYLVQVTGWMELSALPMILLLIAVALCAVPAYGSAAETAPASAAEPGPSENPPTEAAEPAAPEVPIAEATRVDRLHSATENLIDAAVKRVDAFFVNETHDTFEEDKNRVRLRLNLDDIQYHGWDTSAKVKVNVRLTGLSKRLRLVVNDAEEDEEDQATQYEDEGNDVAIRWIGHQGKKTGVSVDGGVRLKSGKVDPFGRLNTSIRYPLAGEWLGQSTNRIYYYSQAGWRNDFRQYFNRPINDELLFRVRSRIQYFEDKDSNPQLEQKFTLFQSLTDHSALAYEALWRRETAEDSVFDEDEITIEPKDKYQQVQLRLRYRHSVWRPWMFVEVWPAIGWMEERDWDTVLGVRLRLEVNFGRHVGLKLDE